MRDREHKRRNLKRRKLRGRRRLRTSPDRPRLLAIRSIAHMYAQIIEEGTGRTLAAVSTRQAGLRARLESGGNIEAAKVVGKAIAEKALGRGIKEVCFDRGGRKYHGRVKALAEAAREAGLVF